MSNVLFVLRILTTSNVAKLKLKDQAVVPPRPGPNERVVVQQLHYIKAPQKYKKGHNLNLYLVRFEIKYFFK